MNDYRQVRIDFNPCSETITDVAAALLADIGFESFVPSAHSLVAYIPESLFDPEALTACFASFPIDGVEIDWSSEFVEGRDWNSEWEKNYFKPIVVGGDKCVIHSSFHKDIPKCRYDIVIDPKMAFGTGHHATTSLIINNLLEMDLEGKSVMDMGTGTGILAILAAMRGAARIDAVEIDEFAQVNAVENVALNGHSEINVMLGDATLLPSEPVYDLFLANINRNVITGDISAYSVSLKRGGDMLLSGFYVEDIPVVQEAAAKYGLVMQGYTHLDNWACMHLVKS